MVSHDAIEEEAERRVGTVLNGKYRLDALLGVGGMGAVYRATHRNRAQLAIKVLHAELSVHEDIRTRFLREAYAANSVKHPGVVRVVDDDIADDGSAFLVMDLLEGATVEALWERAGGRLSVPATSAIVHQLLDVLEAAHRAGVIHRDVKPANLFVTRDGTLRVLDFGIARVLEGGATQSARGVPIGTPTFMAPEQALAKSDAIDRRADVWAAGATFFTLVSGTTVHEGNSSLLVLARASREPARSLADVAPDIPALVVGVVDRALAFDPNMRWPTAAEMRDALEEACRVGFGALPPKSTLSALFARVGAVRVREDIENATTVQLAEGERPDATTDAPISSAQVALPPRRRKRTTALAALLGVLLAASLWEGVRGPHDIPAPPAAAAAHVVVASQPTGAPLVLILPFENRTGDPALDATVEKLLEWELMRSEHLYPLAGRALQALGAIVAPPIEILDSSACRMVAVRSGRPATVVRGAISARREAYDLSLVAEDALSGVRVAALDAHAAAPNRVASAVAGLAAELRAALGESPSPPVKGNAGSDSIEAVHEYVLAEGALAAGKPTDALAHAARSVDIDPAFALAQDFEATTLFDLGRPTDAQAHLDAAVTNIVSLPERLQLRVRGARASTAGDYDDARTVYEQLLARWPEDTKSSADAAMVYERTGHFGDALALTRHALRGRPNDLVLLANIVCMEIESEDFEQALKDGDSALELPGAIGAIAEYTASALALSGRTRDATEMLRRLATVDPSRAAAASADLDIFEGRLIEVIPLLRDSIAADEDRKAGEPAARKWALLASALSRASDRSAAIDAARHASTAHEQSTLFLAGRVLFAEGHDAEAIKLTKVVVGQGVGTGSTLGMVLDAQRLRRHGQTKAAVDLLSQIAPGWGHWVACTELGQAYVEQGAFTDAVRVLDPCWRNRGAVAFALTGDTGLLSLLPPIAYWLARAKDGMHSPEATLAYQEFLALEPAAQGDTLAQDARRRLAAR